VGNLVGRDGVQRALPVERSRELPVRRRAQQRAWIADAVTSAVRRGVSSAVAGNVVVARADVSVPVVSFDEHRDGVQWSERGNEAVFRSVRGAVPWRSTIFDGE